MPKREEIIVGVVEGRPDFSVRNYGVTRVKKHPAYVHGKIGIAALLHRIDAVEAHWYRADYDRLLRLANPRLIARTYCGRSFFLEAGKAGTCNMPKPDAVLCSRCHGERLNFPRSDPETKQRFRQAKILLGCAEEGFEL